jgi:hypothetical protein
MAEQANESGEKLSEIARLTQRAHDVGAAGASWNRWYMIFVALTVVLAAGVFITQFVASRRGTELSGIQNALITEKDRLAKADSDDKTTQIAKVKSEADEKNAALVARAKEADARIAEAQKGSAEANSRAKEAQASLSKAEQHSAEANAKAEGFRLDIAKANESAEQARAQVAAATAEAARANLELARIKAPRTLSNVSALTESLKAYKGTEYTFSSVFGDEESIILLKQLDGVLTNAGWVRIKPPHAFPAINVYGQEQDLAVASGLTSRVSVSVNSDTPLAELQITPVDNLPPSIAAAVALAAAITGSLTPPQEGGATVNVDPGASLTVKIGVGRKP